MAIAPNEPPRTEGKPDPWVGRTLANRYQVGRKLGEGGLGSVYAARQLAVGRDVAIKLLHADVAVRGEHRQRFEREAQTLALLRHPNIVGILDFGVEDDSSYLVMELAEGRTLGELIAESQLPLPLAIDLSRQLLRALACAHGQKVVHRDLKPANVIVRRLPDGSHHLVVLDFGIAKFLEEDDKPSLTKQGAILGTPAYMAPEQATGGSTRPMVDVYAAGLVIFELLTGRRPFVETDRGAMLRAHLMMPAPLPSSIRPELSNLPGIDGFVLRALEKKPANRFADALQMLEAFDKVIGGVPMVAGSTSPSIPMAAPSAAPVALAAPDRTSVVSTVVPVSTEAPMATQATSPSAVVRGLLSRPALVTGVGVGLVAAVVVAGVVASRLFGGSDAPVVPPPVVVPAPAPVVTAASPTGQASPFARGIPSELEVLHRTIVGGANPSRERLQVLYRYNAGNLQDARGQLMLGWTYVNRRWFSDATEAYAEACKREPSSANDARLRADLVRIAAMSRYGDAAARTIVTCLGKSAQAEVEAAARATSDAESRQRLEALASRLR